MEMEELFAIGLKLEVALAEVRAEKEEAQVGRAAAGEERLFLW